MSDPAQLVIGTRASPLAMAQAHETRDRLVRAHGSDQRRLVLRPMTSTGDRIQNRPLAEAGGKGLFTKELDEALIAGRIDLAVHSAKDLPTALPDGLVIAGYLPREDARDVLVSRHQGGLAALPPGARMGTASLRRQAIVLRARPDLQVVLLRGNVGTRLDRVERGEVDATLLALAGLKRLGLEHRANVVLSADDMLPAVGQGAIALVIRAGDARVAGDLAPICDLATEQAVSAERAYLTVLDGSCRTPIAGHARVLGGELDLRGLVLEADGTGAAEVRLSGPATEAERIGREAGLDLRRRLPGGTIPRV
ncbi:hydroxymethylbilane synthase [Enterovirga sp.]|jgi:hydroxymethylbilane synthase|uniref:hydroxymethylbilane synthase n=1 Tax=Enterovirga sp. TaxID=2026350 RepID=UPI00262DEFFD|nr:hydroxymethylbilane synthase [Enterovirga sp.]MDB5590321.1 hydroxymethylbilane synthase [Enterovirga sp.]